MEDLIKRLEAAEVGSRELDRAIWYAVEFDSRGEPSHAPKYTTSLDAALALADRVLPPFRWCMYTQSGDGAKVLGADNDAEEGEKWRFQSEGSAKTVPLALVVAILRAKMETEK